MDVVAARLSSQVPRVAAVRAGWSIAWPFLRRFQQLRLKFAAKNLDSDVSSHKKESNSNYASSANVPSH